jgi:N-acetyl-1-D-myo-inositol-2-amino-2-deoxy-alpha-D-glucopyranoside deacetylase
VTDRPLRPLVTAERRRELDGQPAVVVAVHAHPDDETLATGISLAHFAARGDRVHVITCTLGEEGEVIPPELAHLEGSPELARVRRDELAGAMATLGVRQEFLGGETPRWRDSGMAGSAAARHPDAFAAPDPDEAARLLAVRLEALAPDAVLTYDAEGGYGHPDHVQTHRVTVRALRLLPEGRRPRAYAALTPVGWAREDRDWLARHVPHDSDLHVPGPHEPFPPSVVDDALVTHAVIDPAVVPVRDAALRHHRTQVVVHDGYFALSNGVAARLVVREGYAPLWPEAV